MSGTASGYGLIALARWRAGHAAPDGAERAGVEPSGSTDRTHEDANFGGQLLGLTGKVASRG